MPSDCRDDRGVDALATDVADRDHPVSCGDLEDVIEVPANLLPAASRAVCRSQVKAGNVGCRWRDQVLQRLGEKCCVSLGFLGPQFREQQLPFVPAAFGGVEDRRPNHDRRSVRVALEDGVDERREALPVASDDVEGDLSDLVLHPEHGCVVGLVVDPPACGQQFGERAAADQVAPLVAGPGEKRLIDLDDRAIRRRRDVAARCAFIECLGVVIQES